jgi:DNA-binding IclR family transcriptional regulator
MYKSNNILENGLEVLFLLARGNAPPTIQDVSKSLKISLSTAYRLVDTLIRHGLVEKTGADGRLRLGIRNLILARGVDKQSALLRAALPEMKQLRDLTGETVNLHTIVGYNQVCIESVDTSSPLRVIAPKGDTAPLYAGAGKALLAFLPEKQQIEIIESSGLRKLASNTVTDRTLLLKQLRTVREKGYAHTRSEVVEGVEAVAVPVFDEMKRVVATLSVAGPEHRMRQRNLNEIVEMIKAAAGRISSSL